MKKIILLLFILINFSGFSQSFLDFCFKSKDVDGSILIYDENKDTWLFNIENDVKRNSPIGSLFNIPSTLIALDLGVISNDPGEIMYWDGVKRYYFGTPKYNWSCNTNLDEALFYKNDWYFQNVSDLVRHKNYDFFLKDLDVTNLKFNHKEKYYWHFGNLLSNPEQQINFFRKLYKQEFLFDKKHQKYLFDSMLTINNPNYTIHGYETFNVYKGERIDWWVGVLKTKENTFYFSIRIFQDVNKIKSGDFNNKKFEIAIEIFRLLGYI